jgi:hypothetical protein
MCFVASIVGTILEPESRLERARRHLIDWLQTPEPILNCLSDATASELRRADMDILCQFFRHLIEAGFSCEVTEAPVRGTLAYEIHWKHRGASFVGFKQPPSEESPEEALLTGCAALLDNQWCRSRLQG